jgi:hypothetical protein
MLRSSGVTIRAYWNPSLKGAYYSGIKIYNHLPRELSYPMTKNPLGLP